MASSEKSTVTADIKRNRLLINLKGSIKKRDIDSIYTDIRFCAADLRPGFDVITDLSDARIGYLVGIGTFRKIAGYLKSQGVKNIVRIAPHPTMIAKQLANLSGTIQGYEVTYVKSREEAETLLDQDLQEESG